MPLPELLASPALPRALVVGCFGGVGLVLTTVYSRRGPLIFPVYAALLAGLAFVLARYPALTFSARFVAAFAGYALASVALYVAVLTQANRERRAAGFSTGVSLLGHAWRIAMLAAIGAAASVAVAFISS